MRKRICFFVATALFAVFAFAGDLQAQTNTADRLAQNAPSTAQQNKAGATDDTMESSPELKTRSQAQPQQVHQDDGKILDSPILQPNPNLQKGQQGTNPVKSNPALRRQPE